MNPLLLVILDGWGERATEEANAIRLAKAPFWNSLLKRYPHTTLEASGEAVGLPPGTMGNSEVGHLTIGSGRIIEQSLLRINHAIQDRSFFQNSLLKEAFELARKTDRTVHLMGLLSDGGVHSHESHLFALFQMAKQIGVTEISVHCFLDGRDTSPKSSQIYLQRLQDEMKKSGIGEIGTLIGRYYAMDRDKRWERIQIAYEALVDGKGELRDDPISAIDEVYQKHQTDEFIRPILFKGTRRIEEGDVVIFFNFRADRAREITQALTDPNFNNFPRKRFPKLGRFLCMTQYDKTYPLPVLFPPERPRRILAEILSEREIPQFHTAETEKYAHVTYFFNGGVEQPFPLEERLLVPSPKEVPTYDKKPEMNARQVTEEALKRIEAGVPVVILNYANPDMVGHSGNLPATIQAVEVIDRYLEKLAQAILDRQGVMIVTADHGNCEEMQDKKGGPHTAHTTNPVPFLLISKKYRSVKIRSQCGLQDISPTILEILGVPKPVEMTGTSLIVKGQP